MTKTELIAAIAGATGITKKDVGIVVNEFTEVIQKADKVQLVGFGTFERKTRAAREGRNPQTGATMQIPESKYLAFKGAKGK